MKNKKKNIIEKERRKLIVINQSLILVKPNPNLKIIY